MNQPLVSVIIPTYNRPDFLKEAILSVVNQTYKNIEIIVVDDGTPNEINFSVINSFNDKRIRYVKINNSGGPCKPRNEGIKQCIGEFIKFIYDYDIWEDEKLEILLNVLRKNSEYGLVHHYCC